MIFSEVRGKKTIARTGFRKIEVNHFQEVGETLSGEFQKVEATSKIDLVSLMNYVQNNFLYFYKFLIFFYRNKYIVTKNLQSPGKHLHCLVSQ